MCWGHSATASEFLALPRGTGETGRRPAGAATREESVRGLRDLSPADSADQKAVANRLAATYAGLMLTAALAILLAAQPVEDIAFGDVPTPTAASVKAEALGKLVRCGIKAAQLRTETDAASGQHSVFIVTPAARITAPTYICLARASMEDGAPVDFDDPEATQLFWRSHDAANREFSREKMEQAGLMARLPRYDPAKQSLAEYAGLLDKLCGIAPGKGFIVSGPAWLTVLNPMYAGSDAPPPCLLDAASASNLHEHGVTYGYVGNEPIPAE